MTSRDCPELAPTTANEPSIDSPAELTTARDTHRRRTRGLAPVDHKRDWACCDTVAAPHEGDDK